MHKESEKNIILEGAFKLQEMALEAHRRKE
jgi:hypothetical protein